MIHSTYKQVNSPYKNLSEKTGDNLERFSTALTNGVTARLLDAYDRNLIASIVKGF